MVGRRAAALVLAIGFGAALYADHRLGSDQPQRAPSALAPAADRTDMDLIAGVLHRVERGEPYYEADTAELAARGYSLSSFLNWRLPTLAWIEAALPSLAIAQVAFVIVAIWAVWLLTTALPRGATDQRMATLAASFTMLPLWVVSGRVIVMHEVWAGELIALSVALWRPDRWTRSVAVGLAAVLIRELAAIYLVVMLGAAILERRTREAIGWVAALAVFAVVMAFHIRAASPFVRPGPPHPWVVFGGTDFVLATFRANPAALLLPTSLFIAVVSAAVVGLWFWRHPAGPRLGGFVAAFAAFAMCIGRADDWYWGFLIAPIWPLGLVGFGSVLVESRVRVRAARQGEPPPATGTSQAIES